MGANYTTESYVIATTKSCFGPQYVASTMRTDHKQEFSQRLRSLCDEMGIPERGRLTLLARQFGVSYQAVKKWLDGDGYPAMEHAVAIANWASVSVLWLLQGTEPRRTAPAPEVQELGAAIQELPQDDRQGVLDFVRYKFERADGWFTGEKMARYMKLLDHLSKPPKTGE